MLSMRFDEFARRAETIEGLAGDLDKISRVADLLREAEELGIASRFVQGRVFPAWSERKLNIGPALLYEALSLAGGRSPDGIEELVKETGDVGRAAEQLDLEGQQTLAQEELTLDNLYGSLQDLAGMEGEGSQDRKIRTLADLFIRCDSRSAKYLARLVLGEMRVGVGEGSVRDAIVEAFEVDPELVERGIMVTNDVGEVAEVARREGDDGLAELEMVVGRPVQPMLAQAGSIESVFDDVGADGVVAVEWKYDGARLQIHQRDGEIELYSRRLENLTSSLPDVVEVLEDALADGELILDAEVVAMSDGETLAFQEILRRLRRKYRVEEMQEEVELDIRVFDALYRDGVLIGQPLRERYEVLEEVAGYVCADHWFAESTEEVQGIEADALEAGHEGLMVKNPGSTYSPGRRGKNWLKIKPEPETIDAVVTGGEWGEGRRANLIGSYLLSVRSDGDLETIGRVATGLTDEQLEELTERFRPLIEAEEGKEIVFQPGVVFEVGYEEIQESPSYTSGYALRFPRFLGVRDDKDVEDADSLERVRRLYGQ